MPEHDEPQDFHHDDQPAVRRGAEDVDDVLAAQAGNGDAFARLYERWFDRVLDLAFRVVHDRSLAADIAQDAFLSAHRNLASLADPFAFGGWLLRIARNRAYDRSERERRAVAVDDAQFASIERSGGSAMSAPSGFGVEDRLARASRPEEAAEDNELAALLWDAADALGDRDRDVLDLHLRHGLDPAEIAEVIGINRNAANQTMHRVRQRLAAAIGARVLWRSGAPKCAALQAELDAADVVGFGSESSRLIDRHAAHCEDCDAQRRIRLDPAVLFAATPILSVPALKAKVALALAAEGVPVPRPSDLLERSNGERTTEDPVRRQDPGDGVSRPGSDDPTIPMKPERPSGDGDVTMSQRARRAMLLGALVALVFVAVAIGYTVVPSDDVAIETSPSEVSNEPLPTSPIVTNGTSRPTTTRDVAAATTVDPRAATSTSQAVIVDPTSPPTNPPASTAAPPSATTSTVPPAPAATLRISRDTVGMPGYSPSSATAPRLTWSTTAVASVDVSGPNLTSSDLDGAAVVCPGIAGASYCTLTPSIGTVTYRLRGYDNSGELVVDRSVTLTVTV
jgi:RNA polymerase sigma factor (sigma-70 family)